MERSGLYKSMCSDYPAGRVQARRAVSKGWEPAIFGARIRKLAPQNRVRRQSQRAGLRSGAEAEELGKNWSRSLNREPSSQIKSQRELRVDNLGASSRLPSSSNYSILQKNIFFKGTSHYHYENLSTST